FVISNLHLRGGRLDEVHDHLVDQIGGQTEQIHLRGMNDLMAAPVIVELVLNRFELAVDAFGKELLDALVLGKGNVRSLVEDEAVAIAERDGLSAEEPILLVQRDIDRLTGQPMRRAERGHAGAQYRYFRHNPITPRTMRNAETIRSCV